MLWAGDAVLELTKVKWAQVVHAALHQTSEVSEEKKKALAKILVVDSAEVKPCSTGMVQGRAPVCCFSQPNQITAKLAIPIIR